MATHTFGTLVDPAHFVEIPDPANAGQVIRPPSGTVLLVKDAGTLADLTPITTTAYGYWAYTTIDIPNILVSGDGGATWRGPFTSVESRVAGSQAGVTAQIALETANSALAQVQGASGAVSSVNTKTGAVVLSASDVGARSASVPVPASQTTGFAAVATTGSYNDLTGRPADSIPLAQKGVALGVARLDVDGDVVNAAGTKVTGGGGGGAVSSVNTKTGAVVLNAADVGADASGAASSAVSAHASAADPHTVYTKKINEAISLTAGTQSHLTIDIGNDGTSTSTWVDRLRFRYLGKQAGYFNEYGELRARPGTTSTVALRAQGHTTPNNVDIFQVAPEGGTATPYFAVNRNAVTATVPVAAPNIGPKIVVGTTAPTDTTVIWADTSGL